MVAGAETASLNATPAMPASLTEGSPNTTETTQMPDSQAAACFPTSFTEVVEEEAWGSFYSSFKVSVLPCTPNTDFKKQDK